MGKGEKWRELGRGKNVTFLQLERGFTSKHAELANPPGTNFKTGAFNRSAIPPYNEIKHLARSFVAVQVRVTPV